MRDFFVLLLVSLAVAGSIVEALATETVHFESAQYRLGALTARRAAEDKIPRPPAPTINGYLVKPNASGPFPAIILLHGCDGLSEPFKADPAKSPWVSRLVDWGYAVLAVDSFTARGVTETCDVGIENYRVADAYGALRFLSHRSDIDIKHIILLGFSAGGIAVLSVVQKGFDLFEVPPSVQFKAAIAFYPFCTIEEGVITAPTLILIGELDDWCPVARCRSMIMGGRGEGASITMIVYPGAYHAFNVDQPARQVFGHHLEYNQAAAEDSVQQVRQFLSQQ
jgi:dienelactone hydrolase